MDKFLERDKLPIKLTQEDTKIEQPYTNKLIQNKKIFPTKRIQYPPGFIGEF